MKIRHLLRVVLVCAFGCIASPSFAQFGGLGDLLKKQVTVDNVKKVTDAGKDISEADEIHIGEGVASMILGASPLYKNDELQAYVNRVGRWIAVQSSRPDLPWGFAVIDTPSIEAFSTPGGQVFVSIGLMRKLKSESELAGVLAHEVAHVALKHQVQAIQAAKRAGAWGDIGQSMAKDKLASTQLGSSQLGSMLGNAFAQEGIEFVKNGLFLKPLDRSLEYDADRLAVVLAARAGYDSYGLMAVLQQLTTVTPDESTGSLSMSTHPTPNERLNELDKYAPTLDRYATQPQVVDRFAKVMAAAK